MTLVLEERDVVRRRAAIPRLLKPLRGKGKAVACDFDSSAFGGGRILAAHDGSRIKGGNYRTWFFRTYVDELRAQYFEVWRDIGGGMRFELHQAYLHMYRVPSASESPYELIALHADPSDDHQYKKGPHIHVVKSESPLPHCHIALYPDRVEEVTSSIESLDSAMKIAVKLVADEVLGAYSG